MEEMRRIDHQDVDLTDHVGEQIPHVISLEHEALIAKTIGEMRSLDLEGLVNFSNNVMPNRVFQTAELEKIVKMNFDHASAARFDLEMQPALNHAQLAAMRELATKFPFFSEETRADVIEAIERRRGGLYV